jgi:nitrate reductase gamma subunit
MLTELASSSGRMSFMNKEGSHCFRLRPFYRNIGIAGIAFMGGMACLSIWAWFHQPNAQVNMPGVISGFLAFTTLYVWLLLLYLRYRLYVNNAGLLQVGVMTRKRIRFDGVNELKWRRWPRGGSARLSELTAGVSIGLDGFSNCDRHRVIDLLRNSVDASKQHGWTEFSAHFLDRPQQKRLSRSFGWLIIALVVAHAIGFLIWWFLGFGIQYLLFAIVNAAVGAYLCVSFGRHFA